ncbi:MAG: hypothetical protein GEV11_12000 [Streptosporangiales bacterium]|nr:hypothetical protein [Streptosporangiales bacterium]
MALRPDDHEGPPSVASRAVKRLTKLTAGTLAGLLVASGGGLLSSAWRFAPDGHAPVTPLRYGGVETVSAHGAPAGDRRLLAHDPAGDGRVVQVFGDTERATRIAVVVPGSGQRLDNFAYSAVHPGTVPRSNAHDLWAELRRQDPGAHVAVVAWLGYDTPEAVDRMAVRSERAEAGARDLARLVRTLSARGARITLIGHSYGSVVAGLAARHAPVAEVVALASPGLDADHAAELGGARVWAARTDDDPIRFVPNVRVRGYGHGADPVDPEFGAIRFLTGATAGHDDYYAPHGESLANMARIVLGRTAEVTRW